ncbi:lipopolysaccharide assembly protein LapB [Lacinutrix sp. Hel_I_90]|uniref:tetratricopeptide repeat protein n=1 Tax=Lacinutrix sp. Hel_I_90 TaxID=1249999 RepID=UPI0005CA0C94|nr:tetratricopeptide repeat protein [Lacinutrix sp. Hel_I_90]
MKNKFLVLVLVIIFKAEAQSSVLTIGDSLLAYGNYAKAITILQTHSNQNEVYYKLAKAYHAIGHYDAALTHYDKALDSDQDNRLLAYDYGKLLGKTKQYRKASKLFRVLVNADSLNSNYHYELGVNLDAIDEEQAAQEHFEKAFIIDSTHQKAIYRLARFQLKKGQHEAVIRLVDVGLKSYPRNTLLISLKAQSFYNSMYFNQAIVWFEKLIALGERSSFIYEKLSVAYARELEYEKAISNLEEVLKLEPKNASNVYKLGDLYFKAEDYVNAEKYIKYALELQDTPLDKEYNRLASIYNYLKRPEEAVAYYKKALKENPENENTRFSLVITKDSYYKDIEARIKLYEAYLKTDPGSQYTKWAEDALTRLKTEKFMSDEGDKK